MKAGFLQHQLFCLTIAVAVSFVFSPFAHGLELISNKGLPAAASGGGNGDSGAALISPDGRYLLFSSTANNLMVNSNGNPIPVSIPVHSAVYLRDQSNNTTTLISWNLSGTSTGNGDSLAKGISSNGLFALFESSATDLVTGVTNGLVNVFLRDVTHGTNILASVSTNGGSGNGNSTRATMTPDGRYVAFMSSADNLVPGDTNGIPDIFVRDMQSGTTTLISVGAAATSATAGNYSAAPQITPDGRYVVFYSSATNLVAGVTNFGDIFVRDLVLQNTYWASAGARAALNAVFGTSNGVCFSPKISADGSAIAYEASLAGFTNTAGVVLRYNLASGLTDVVNTNGNAPVAAYEDIRNLDISANGRFVANVGNLDSKGLNTAVYLWDALSGSNLLVSANINNASPTNGASYAPMVDATGRYVAFLSQSTNLTTNVLTGDSHLYFRDTVLSSTLLVDVDGSGIGRGVNPVGFPNLGANASALVFESAGWGDRNQYMDVYINHLGLNSNALVSISSALLSSQSPDGPNLFASLWPISTNGQRIVFVSEADNLVPNDTNGLRDVFVRDLYAGTNILVSADTNGFPAAGASSEASLSGDGRYVVFSSSAASLVAGDTNNALDVFERDLQNGTTTLISVNQNGTGPGDSNSYTPLISSNGRFVLFRSQARTLTAGSFGAGVENLFLRDLQLGTNYALTAGTSGTALLSAAMTPDGHYVAFVGVIAGSSAAYLYLWDSQQAKLVYTNATASLNQVAISPDGQRLAYGTSASLFIADRTNSANNATVGSGSNGSFNTQWTGNFSADGRWLAFETTAALVAADTNGLKDVYLYDVLGRTNLLVSQNLSGFGGGDGVSDSPSISSDGRFVAFRSYADNLVSGDSNGVPDLFLLDRTNGAITLLTTSQYGNRSGDNRSLVPLFTSDSQTLMFQSAASDLVTNDGNRTSDLFSLSLFAAGTLPTFYVQPVPPSATRNPGLTWPVLSGKTYEVQFKNNLSDANWQTASGGITIVGGTASFTDPAPAIAQRFYRVVGF